jgi:hypothetical protein
VKAGSLAWVATLISSSLLGCSLTSEPKGPAELRGTLLASFPDMVKLTWSTDGSELFFIEGISRVRAVSASGGNPRTLYSSNISIGHIEAVANKLYLSIAKPSSPIEYYIVRIDPGSSPLDVDTVLTYSGQVRNHLFSVSHDERFVAFGDSLFDVPAGTQRALSLGIPWSFSPDGSKLLYALETATPTSPSFLLVATSDGTSESLSPIDNVGTRGPFGTGAHYWDGNDPKVLRVVSTADRTRFRVFVQDLRTGTNQEIASIEGETSFPFSSVAVSRDGQRALISMGPFFSWNEIRAIDTQSGSSSVVARATGFSLIDYFVLSPNGNRAAYIFIEYEGLFDEAETMGVYVSEL